MRGIKYTSSAKSPSGYGEAARNFIASLFISGLNVTCETISQMNETTTYGITGSIQQQLEERDIDYQIKIIHLTPDLLPTYAEKGKYIISHLFWETDLLPQEWIKPLNEIDEIWTASEQMAEMIQRSGVTTPTYCFSQPIDVGRAYEKIKPFSTQYKRDFTFYSCFQWIERKNPKGLLEAYWREFEGNDEVTLLLKTYRITYLDGELALIKDDIRQWKKELGLKHYPKIHLVHRVLSEYEMMRFHKMGDVFINPSSGEGWCRPMQEAMLLGNPVISGSNGGITDILTPKYYFKVESDEVQAVQQPFIPWYASNMKWRQISGVSLQQQMADAWAMKNTREHKAKEAQQFVINNFSFQEIGQQMKERIEQIYKKL